MLTVRIKWTGHIVIHSGGRACRFLTWHVWGIFLLTVLSVSIAKTFGRYGFQRGERNERGFAPARHGSPDPADLSTITPGRGRWPSRVSLINGTCTALL